eukprot:7376649-Prymnesium_polylepis.1
MDERFAKSIEAAVEVNMLTTARLMFSPPSFDAFLPLFVVSAQLGSFAALTYLALFKTSELDMISGLCPNTADIPTRVIMLCISGVYAAQDDGDRIRQRQQEDQKLVSQRF